MSAVRAVAAIAIASATFAAVACSVDVDLSNKACPCGADWVCDTSRNVCVLPQDLGSVEAGAGDGGAPCANDRCPCTVDRDCTDPARARCSPEKVCVECLRAPDTCPAGSWCNEQNQCTLGCKQESDCQISPAVPHCNTATHQCVECVTTSQCAADAGLLCSPSGACVEGCDLDAGIGCTGGKKCCGSFCIDTTKDVLNCGACGTACSTTNATPRCSAGACAWTCASGFGHCTPGNTGCETNLRTDVTKCGSCTRNCTTYTQNANGITCNAGACNFTSCKAGFGNCDTSNANGCECACGSFAGQICCPGNVCNFPGGRCISGGGGSTAKCQ